MISAPWLVAALLALAFTQPGSAHAKDCATLDDCLQELLQTAKEPKLPGAPMRQETHTLAERIASFPGAAEALVPLLADPDPDIAERAGLALSAMPSIPPEYFDAIRAGLERGLGWLPAALGRIDSEKAAREAVDRYLASRSAPHNQEAAAVVRSGVRAIPRILERAACSPPCPPETHWLLGTVLEQIQPGRERAAEGLMGIAEDPDAPPQTRRGVLGMIGALGRDGLALEPRLLALKAQAPELGAWMDGALVEIGSRRSGEILARRLRQEPSAWMLRDIAETGEAARGAGSAVAEFLAGDPLLRAPAALTLGYIGYEPAVPTLVAALDDPVDPRATWAAAKALGHLRADAALGGLSEAATAHWYPPTREAARSAVRQIRGEEAEENDERGTGFAMRFFGYEHLDEGIPECEVPAERRHRESHATKLYAHRSPERMKRLAYPSQIVSYGADDEEAQRAAGETVIRVHSGNLREHREIVEQTPGIALRVGGGWLAGSDRGEWGGELMFLPDAGAPQHILDANIEDIYQLGDAIVVTTGLAHLSMNQGVLYRATRDAQGAWQAEVWRILPGAPAASHLVKPDELLVRTRHTGTVVVDAEGRMRMARCRKAAATR